MATRMGILLVILTILLCSCTTATVALTVTPVPTGLLTPYHTLTPSPVSPTATFIITVPVTPAPTSTPFLHTITNDDTMLGIAYKYGITLEQLEAANPGVDPHFLSVGKQLIIPLGGKIPETAPTVTPAPLNISQPSCYPTGDGGAWCILSVRNDLEASVEDISAWIGLFTSDGKSLASQTVYAPLDLLRPGTRMPLMAYFAPPLPADLIARGELLSALTIPAEDSRYLDAQVKLIRSVISQDGQQAQVSGLVDLGEHSAEPAQLWALVVAYDSTGKVIGARKWEAAGETQLDMRVYSLAGRIDHVEVLLEALP